MTPLANWMQRNAKTDQWLAEHIGRDRTTALRIRRGQMVPSLPAAVAIEVATAGEIRASDLLPPPSPSSSEERVA